MIDSKTIFDTFFHQATYNGTKRIFAIHFRCVKVPKKSQKVFFSFFFVEVLFSIKVCTLQRETILFTWLDLQIK